MLLRYKIAMAWVGLQVLFFLGWSGFEHKRLRPGEGESVLVHVRPLDPRDYLRGQYFLLGYDFSRPNSFPNAPDVPEGGEVWAVLAPGQGDDLGFHVPVRASATPPTDLGAGEVALLGHAERWRYSFGVEEYFVPEGTETPRFEDLSVRLRIGGDGAARIEKVYLKGRPWP
jgi:uncharacterized membrane-anchored protein